VKVFVTGASGFIGGALAARLAERGDEVVGLARSDRAAAEVERRGARAVRGDLLDEDSLVHGMEGCELAFHVAGVNTHCPPDPGMLLRVNVDGAASAVRAAAAAGVPKVVYTSSAASVGERPGTIGREDTIHRGSYLSVYDRSKHLGEQAAFVEARRHGIHLSAVNPSSVQGPGRDSGNGKIIIAYLSGKLPVFVDTYVSVVDIADTTEAHVLAAERGRAGARYILNGATITSAEALDLVAEVSGVRHEVRIVPPPVARSAAALLEAAYKVRGRVPSLCRARIRTFLHGHQYDGSLVTRELGLVYTPVEETFRRTIAWAESEGLIDFNGGH
jgi:dihydroflavonol-4-reductase